jgi:hypothetical protein
MPLTCEVDIRASRECGKPGAIHGAVAEIREHAGQSAVPYFIAGQAGSGPRIIIKALSIFNQLSNLCAFWR